MNETNSSPRERWDSRYARSTGFDCRDPRDVVMRAAPLANPGVALDLACGRGRNALYLASLGWQVTAVDVSPVALEGIEHPNITTLEADLESGEFSIPPASFDLIVDTLYLQRSLFPSIREGLRENGLLAAEIPIEDAEAPPMNPLYVLAPGELQAMFADWTIEAYEECASTEHLRKTARLIARKPTPERP